MDNRFLQFFNTKKRLIAIIKSFFILAGIVGAILFSLELLFAGIADNDSTVSWHEGKSYRHHPYLDHTMKHRETINPCTVKETEPLRIHMYGGSTMFGAGTHPPESIPSYYAKILCKEGVNVEVKNMGQFGYNSSQEVLKLILGIKKGDIPDIAIFYDGVNEMREHKPGYPANLETKNVFKYHIQKRDSQTYFPNTIEWIGRKMVELGLKEVSFPTDDLEMDYFDYPEKPHSHDRVLEVYSQNVGLVKNIENVYDFTSFFYWQPDITTKSPFSEEEKGVLEDERWYGVLNTYSDFQKPVSSFLDNNDRVMDLRNIFDNYEKTIFFDDSHKTPEGNRIVAERMAKDTLEYLKDKQNYE